MEEPTILGEAAVSPPTSRKGFSGMNSGLRSIILSILAIVFNVAMNVSLPVYAGTMDVIGGDTFCVLLVAGLWFPIAFFFTLICMKFFYNRKLQLKAIADHRVLFFVGLMTTFNGIFVVFSSPPDRTPSYLQGILTQSGIPYTIICRYILLRKGISTQRLICTCLVLVGLFITVEPQIWGINIDDSSNSSQSTAGRILWPLSFSFGFLPYAISNVIAEKSLKTEEADSLNFVSWVQFYQILTMLPMFWVDFLPGFGMADSFSAFGDHLSTGLRCTFSSASDCNGLAGKTWLFVASYLLGNLFSMLLIQYAEGAVYAVIVQSMIAPLATLFWTLFQFDPVQNRFWWGPNFNETTVFTIVGLTLVVPGVMLYNYFSNKEARNKTIELEIEEDFAAKADRKQVVNGGFIGSNSAVQEVQ